jgi:hypothetical protein
LTIQEEAFNLINNMAAELRHEAQEKKVQLITGEDVTMQSFNTASLR